MDTNQFIKLFQNSDRASIICKKDISNPKLYNCKMGLDIERKLLNNNGFLYTQSFCDIELEHFIKSLNAIDTCSNDINRWVVMDDKPKFEIYSFDRSNEIHIIK